MSLITGRPVIPLPIIVEGRYDKSAILGMFDATVITTEGFSIFKSAQKRALVKRLAVPGGVIVLTDSDGGGRQIRSFLSSILPKELIYNVYIPKIAGKEKRKRAPSKEGLLGVEGVGGEVLRTVLMPFVDMGIREKPRRGDITSYELYEHGLLGAESSSGLRDAVCRELSLPDGMSAKAFLEAINISVSREEFAAALAAVSREDM